MTAIDKYKSIYRNLCRQERSLSIFSQDWWLDAVCDQGDWNVCLTFNKGGEVTSALPYYHTKYFGLNVIKMPKLTPFIDLWINYPVNLEQQNRRYAFEKKVIKDLILQLPDVAFSSQNISYSLTNWLPFFWQGYQQTTFYSYRIEDLTDLENVFSCFKTSIRNKIRNAEKKLEVVSNDDIDSFYEINQMSFRKQGLKMNRSFAFVKKLDDTLKSKNARKIYFAKDTKGNIHSAIYVVFDHQSAYKIATGINQSITHPGAVQLLIWKAIKDAAVLVNCFDFAGSMIPGVEPMFSSFGGLQKPYFHIQKNSNKLFSLLNLLRKK